MKKKCNVLSIVRMDANEILLKMKLLTLMIFCAFVSASANSYSQATKFSLEMRDVSIGEVFQKIEEQSEFVILFNENTLNINRKVDVIVKDKTVENILDQIFDGNKDAYKIFDHQIAIYPNEIRELPIITKAETSAEQKKTISGNVKDRKGIPIPGVTVLLKGTTTGTITDINGEFKIAIPTGAKTMLFSFVGMKGQEIQIDNKTVINIVLTEENFGLKDVVVVAYGTQNKRNVTGAITTIEDERMSDQPVMTFAQQLQGRIAGVQVSQVSGQPGRGMAFRVRGSASLSSGSSPLFVIDGLPITGDINNINPSEIETYTVLKDAAATALYGSRASNGVILITTKHSKKGETKITMDANYGVQMIPEDKVPQMMNARQFAQYMYDRHQDRLAYETNVPPLNAVYSDPTIYGEGTNWFKVITRAAPTQNYNLSILSSKERSSSAVMLGYQEQQGVLVNTGTKLLSLRINSDYRLINDRLKIGFNLAPSYRMDHNNRLTTDGLTGLFMWALEASPIGVPVNPDGTYPYNVNSPGMVTCVNPYSVLKNRQSDYNTTRLLGNGYANFEILPGLLLKANLGIDKGIEFTRDYSPTILSSTGIATGGSNGYDTHSWTAETNLQYTKSFKDHNFEVLAGYSAEKYNSFSNSVGGQGFSSDDVPYLAAASSITSGSSGIQEFSLLSAIGRINYSYKGRYLMSGAFRNDGSSRFGANKKYGSFPSASGGWIVSEENFMKEVKAISLLKFRGSWGITGNNNIGNYTYIAKLSSNLNYFANNALYPGATVTSLENNDLAWERNEQLDLGFDLNLLNSRVNIVYDYYRKFTDGLIQSRPIPRASGFASVMANIGEFEFWGHELTVSTENLTGKFKWNTSFNISLDRNKIKSLVSPGYLDYGSTGASNYYRNQVGRPLGMFFGYVFDGLYKDANDLANSPKYSGGSTLSEVGTIKFKDLNNNGVVEDVNDRTFIGNPTPDFMYGMTNNFQYKNLDLNISMTGQVGGDILNNVKWTHFTNMDGARNLLAAAADRWRSPSNPGSGVYPRTLTNTTALGRYANSQWVENGTYLAVKNISLGYTFKIKSSSALEKVRVFGSVQQAFVFTNYTGMSPEPNLSGLDAARGIGIDVSQYPIPRTFAFGASISFK